jgi:mannitol-1-phosphate 5-dehydrogenase
MPSTSQSAPAAVQFGAGNIGRGFMGELFRAAGLAVVFVDVDRGVVDALNARGAYEVHHVTSGGDNVVTIDAVRALDARDAASVAKAVAGAAVVCTAVGVRALGAVAPVLAAGLALRAPHGKGDTLNVITCENLVGAGSALRELVWQATPASRAGEAALTRQAFDARFGFVEAVVSRMVPIVPDNIRRRDPLWIACEPYARLPVDARAVRGPLPPIPGLEPVDNIQAYQRRKLATHNMSHAVAAYLGHEAGHEFIWQAMADDAVLAAVRGAMAETGRALVSRFDFDPAAQAAHEADLLERYRNRALGDQVRRVAADPLRKLGREDRLIGSARLCLEEGVEPAHVLAGIRAALRYSAPDDPAAARLQGLLQSHGLPHVLREVCGLASDDPLAARLLAADAAGRGR